MYEVKIITKYREANPWEVFKFFNKLSPHEGSKVNEEVRCLVCLETKSLSLEQVFLSTSTKEEYFTFLVTESQKIYNLIDANFPPDFVKTFEVHTESFLQESNKYKMPKDFGFTDCNESSLFFPSVYVRNFNF